MGKEPTRQCLYYETQSHSQEVDLQELVANKEVAE